jgi:glycosyltransferase involved in cell wall biosynthesis
MDNRFIIVIGSYNNEKWVSQNIESVLKQTHKNWRMVYYDACSEDNTYEIAKRYMEQDSRINLITTGQRNLKTWLFDKLTEFENIKPNDIICVLDGDDFLASDDVLNYLNEVYNQTHCWMTYGGMICWEGGDKTREAYPQNSEPPPEVFTQKLYRRDLWRYSHMRTCRGFLWKKLTHENFVSEYDGNYFTLDDLCTVYPMLEMCPARKIYRVEDHIYIWNASESRGCAENKTNNIGQHYEAELRTRRPPSKELTVVSPVLAGGLGNQMFEIAAAASLAKDNNALLVINPTEHILPNQGKPAGSNLSSVFSQIIIDEAPPTSDHITVETLCYEPMDFKPNIKLRGHFQSYKYFHHNRQYILDLFAPTFDIRNHIAKTYPADKSKITAIQVRRGDYSKFPNSHPLLSPEYPAKAVKIIGSERVWIFSDDLEWCKENLHFDCPTEYIKDEDYIEMYLMSLCKNIVIANSSFGWWAGYLKTTPGQVFAPNPWFGPALLTKGFKYEDLIPSDWTVISTCKE